MRSKSRPDWSRCLRDGVCANADPACQQLNRPDYPGGFFRHGSQWAAMGSIAGKTGCTPETLRLWVRQAERDRGLCGGLTTAEQDRIKQLERENRQLRQANEILRKASA